MLGWFLVDYISEGNSIKTRTFYPSLLFNSFFCSFSSQANVTIPSPVPETSIQNLRQIVEEGNKRFQESKEEVEFSTHSNESPVISELIPEKAKKKESIRKFLTPGTKVRILKGPFRNFKADVVELVPRQRKVSNFLVFLLNVLLC